MKSRRLKVGAKVKVLDKTTATIGLPFFSWNRGDIGYVKRIIEGPQKIDIYWLSKSLNGEEKNGGFGREDLELVEDKTDWNRFKIGDKVRAIDKSIPGFGWNESWKRRNIGYVYRTNRYLSDGRRCIEVLKEKDKYWNNGFFNPEDLELIKEEKMRSKYVRGEKDLTIIDILKATKPSHKEKQNFSYNMIHCGYFHTSVIEIDNWFIEYVLNKDKCFIKWLLENDYVKEEEEEFKPFNLTLEIRSEDELKSIWHRFNFITRDINFTEYDKSPHSLSGKTEYFISSRINIGRLWKEVDDKLRDLNLK